MSTHDERLSTIRSTFAQVNDALATEATAVPEDVATRAAAEGWNGAQVVHHVALTTEFLAGALSGGIAEVLVPMPEGFTEQMASMDFSHPIKTFPMLEPPEDATMSDAVARLRASAGSFQAAVDSMSEERCSHECIQLPFALLSLYEAGEFTAAHVVRHTGQMRRVTAD